LCDCHHRGQKYSQAIADEVFDIFSEEVASEERPLYFHTGEGVWHKLDRVSGTNWMPATTRTQAQKDCPEAMCLVVPASNHGWLE
jgi:hypothetical protein